MAEQLRDNAGRVERRNGKTIRAPGGTPCCCTNCCNWGCVEAELTDIQRCPGDNPSGKCFPFQTVRLGDPNGTWTGIKWCKSLSRKLLDGRSQCVFRASFCDTGVSYTGWSIHNGDTGGVGNTRYVLIYGDILNFEIVLTERPDTDGVSSSSSSATSAANQTQYDLTFTVVVTGTKVNCCPVDRYGTLTCCEPREPVPNPGYPGDPNPTINWIGGAAIFSASAIVTCDDTEVELTNDIAWLPTSTCSGPRGNPCTNCELFTDFGDHSYTMRSGYWGGGGSAVLRLPASFSSDDSGHECESGNGCTTLDGEDCDCDGLSSADDYYVQARRCSDDALVDLWMLEQFATGSFKRSGVCYYFNDEDEASTTPGTIIAPEDTDDLFVDCANCEGVSSSSSSSSSSQSQEDTNTSQSSADCCDCGGCHYSQNPNTTVSITRVITSSGVNWGSNGCCSPDFVTEADMIPMTSCGPGGATFSGSGFFAQTDCDGNWVFSTPTKAHCAPGVHCNFVGAVGDPVETITQSDCGGYMRTVTQAYVGGGTSSDSISISVATAC